jgi:hypothetical protein
MISFMISVVPPKMTGPEIIMMAAEAVRMHERLPPRLPESY